MEIKIEKEDINTKVRIINSYDEFMREKKLTIIDFYKNEMEIKESCKMEIDGNVIPFSYFYSFKQKGKHIIKYIFFKNITNANYISSDCKSLIKIDLSNFNMQKITNFGGIFYGCKHLENIDLSNIKTENVINTGYMFYKCNSLKSIDLSNFNIKNVSDMAYMFSLCENLINIELSKLNTEKVSNMNGMFMQIFKIFRIVKI